ncbi:MAG: PIG-L family deacetylase [Chloroflexi bacterium]|nr:PIG-L family deacetylase [Chloroflexota bacterium]
MGQQRILGIFAHPDDETSSCAGTFMRYAGEGARITVVTATRGEKGALGTSGLTIARQDLPKVREQEQRAVARLLGVADIIYLGHIDGEVKDIPQQRLTARIQEVMEQTQPQAVITFGPLGISRHPDHIAVSRAATAAFAQYQRQAKNGAALYYVAIPKRFVEQVKLDLDGVETQLTITIDISPYRARKVQALRMYRSQQDAQDLAEMFERMPEAAFECFHQAQPPVANGIVKSGFW